MHVPEPSVSIDLVGHGSIAVSRRDPPYRAYAFTYHVHTISAYPGLGELQRSIVHVDPFFPFQKISTFPSEVKAYLVLGGISTEYYVLLSSQKSGCQR